MAMGMTKEPNSIICSIDKDLLQVPGHHWNWKRGVYSVIDEEEGRRSLYTQMLTGDTADGIPGIHKIGPVKAKKALAMVSSEWMMYCVVLKMYIDMTPLQPEERYRTEDKFLQRMVALVESHARLLYLLRTEDDKWEAPKNE
jgi:5'-3' exonuclease